MKKMLTYIVYLQGHRERACLPVVRNHKCAHTDWLCFPNYNIPTKLFSTYFLWSHTFLDIRCSLLHQFQIFHFAAGPFRFDLSLWNSCIMLVDCCLQIFLPWFFFLILQNLVKVFFFNQKCFFLNKKCKKNKPQTHTQTPYSHEERFDAQRIWNRVWSRCNTPGQRDSSRNNYPWIHPAWSFTAFFF